MPSRRLLATLSIVVAGALVPAGIADAASKKASRFPTIKTISPMTVSIGETMTIAGTGFIKGKAKNTVVFRRSGKRAIFVKADGLSTKRLRLTVPEKLRGALGTRDGQAVASRFQLRVLAKRFGKRYTTLKQSPLVRATPAKASPPKSGAVTPAPLVVARQDPPPPPPSNCDGDPLIDDLDADDDNDLLSDTTEATIRTNRCLADTDGDGMEDGWEYKSAVDLNRESCPGAEYPLPCAPVRPYPGKRPYPNPLDSTDAGTDYDGDWLVAHDEYTAWLRKGRANGAYRTLTNMWYSDGLQGSQDTNPADGCHGVGGPQMPAPLGNDPDYTLDRHNRGGHGLGCLTDDERDEDGDYLTNLEERYEAMSGAQWWSTRYAEPLYKVVYDGTDWLDADTDGDGTVDGKDDEDNDDFWNAEEVERGTQLTDKDGNVVNPATGLWVDPFNPCLPAVKADTCPRVIPLTGTVWRPFYRLEDGPPAKRWPLYNEAVPATDPLWTGVALPHVLPPAHPIPRPF